MSPDRRLSFPQRQRPALAVGIVTLVGVLAAGCSSGSGASSSAAPGAGATGSASARPHSGSSASSSPTSSAAPTPTPIPTDPRRQSCDGRLGAAISGPPKALPRPANAVFSDHSVQDGQWSGYLRGTDTVAPIDSLRAAFVRGGFHAGPVKTTGTSSRFTFSGGKYSGTAYIAVLCTGELRLLYQFDHGSKFGPNPAPTVTRTAHHKPKKHGGR